jgi:hypothetical protein
MKSATAQLKPRSATSYLQEYALLSSKDEINAYWERMDSIILNMNIEDKTLFFKQLENDIDESASQLDQLMKLAESM